MPKIKVKKAGSFVDLGSTSGSQVTGGGASTTPGSLVGVQSIQQNSSAGTSVTIPVPAGVQEGDILVYSGASSDYTDHPTPSGWTQLYKLPNNGSFQLMWAYYRVATASEPASYTINRGVAANTVAAIHAWRGVQAPVLGTAANAAFAGVSVAQGAIVVGDAGMQYGVTDLITGSGWTTVADLVQGSEHFLSEYKVAAAAGTLTPAITAAEGYQSSAVWYMLPTTNDHTISTSNINGVVEMANSTLANVTIPTDANADIAVGSFVTIRRAGTGAVVIAPASGVTLQPASSVTISKQWREVTLFKRAANSWVAIWPESKFDSPKVDVNNQTGVAYTLVAADAGKLVELNNASAITLTIPSDASASIAIDTVIELWQQGAGQVTVVPAGGVTLRSPGGLTKLYGQYSGGTLRKRAANEWVLQGDLA